MSEFSNYFDDDGNMKCEFSNYFDDDGNMKYFINNITLKKALHSERALSIENERLLGEIDNIKKALNESLALVKKLRKSLEEDIFLVKKNTFNCKTWECEYVDKYYFNWTEKKVVIKYDDELDEPKTAYDRVCMEEAGIIKKIDDTEEFYRKMRKTKKEGAISKDELTAKGLKASVKS